MVVIHNFKQAHVLHLKKLLHSEVEEDHIGFLSGKLYVCQSEEGLKQIVGTDLEFARNLALQLQYLEGKQLSVNNISQLLEYNYSLISLSILLYVQLISANRSRQTCKSSSSCSSCNARAFSNLSLVIFRPNSPRIREIKYSVCILLRHFAC